MAVRVRVRICSKERCVVTSALVNSGYETGEPEMLLPRRLADFLGVARGRGEALVYETPFGFYRLLHYPSALEVELVDVGVKVSGVGATVSEFEREALISDKLASAPGIQLLDVGRGLWRHASDPPGRVRESARPEYW